MDYPYSGRERVLEMLILTCFLVFVVYWLSPIRLFETPWIAAHQASLFPIMPQSLLKFMSIESVILPTHLSICCALFLLPSIFLSIKVFSKESALCIRWPKYQSFSFNISPFNKYSGLISFSTDWFDLLAAQDTLQESSPAPQFESILGDN